MIKNCSMKAPFLFLFTLLMSSAFTFAQGDKTGKRLPYKNGNPIVPYVGMADPHIFIFDDKAYLYATRDIDSLQTRNKFVMPDWHIWSSQDLIHWDHERTIYPTETYMGKSNDCWATDMGYRNGKYYFYFSNKNLSTGVMISDHPAGPFKDKLGKPLLDTGLTTSKEYDPTILIDDDAERTPYIVFGHHKDNDPLLGYYIARLNEDMISLAEVPRRINFTADLDVMNNDDKPNLHKYKGVYYLSSGSHYATSTNVYGPYTKRGNSGFGKFGLTAQAHGNYFMWNQQWFHTWCKFHLGKEVARYRESYITYVHYKADGTMIDDTVLLSKHFGNGVGQYQADWDRIEAEWYMAGNKIEKGETADGFQVKSCYDQGYLYFPNIGGLRKNSKISLWVNPHAGGRVEVRSGSITGPLLGILDIPLESSKEYFMYSGKLKNNSGPQDIYLVFRGDATKNLFSIDWMKFD
jgi:arabinoxylan arabinofuranohydrolase